MIASFEKCKKSVDNGCAFGVLLTDLSKAFVILCAICYHLYNLKNVKNTHGRVIILEE